LASDDSEQATILQAVAGRSPADGRSQAEARQDLSGDQRGATPLPRATAQAAQEGGGVVNRKLLARYRFCRREWRATRAAGMRQIARRWRDMALELRNAIRLMTS